MIKKIIPLEVLWWFKYLRKYINSQQQSYISNNPIAYLLDAPDYGNLGDQAIAYAMHYFLRKKTNFDVYEISGDNLPYYLKSLKKNIRSQDIICLVGGGNMGSVYPIYEATRRIIIKSFPKNKIIIFPQTIEYEKSFYGQISQVKSQLIYSKHKNLFLAAREKTTYNLLKILYTKNNVILSPDIVLYLHEYSDLGKERNGIAICLRNDQESILTSEERMNIVNIAEEIFETIYRIDTTTNIKVTLDNRKEILENKLSEFASKEFIITDRLHGMIFAAITSTPCIIIKSKNNKIPGVYAWIKELPYIYLINNTCELYRALDLLKSGRYIDFYKADNFYTLSKAINT